MAEQKITCGDVDGKGLECAWMRHDSDIDNGPYLYCECDEADISSNHPCHCNAARLAALAKQDGELVKLLKECYADMRPVDMGYGVTRCNICTLDSLDGKDDNHTLDCRYIRFRAALAERGVEV